jgi:hypothetical protein
MSSKFNLSDAAKEILSEGSKETFDSIIASKKGQRELTNPDKVGVSRIDSKTAYGTNDAGKIGDSPNDVNDPLPDYFKGTKTATPPGATPPVGCEPMKVLPKQPGQEKAGDVDKPGEMGSYQNVETPYEKIRDRAAQKLPTNTWQKNANANFQSYGGQSEETEFDDEETISEEGMKMSKKAMMQEKMKEKMKEDIDALLSGENLSEEFVTKATTIFEAAVIARAEEVIAEAEQELVEEFEIAVEQIKEELASKVDDYLNYMVEEWMQENQLAVESGLRSEVTEDFINGLRDLFVEHYIDIPEDKVDVVEGLSAKVEELEDALNEQIHRGIQLSKELNEQKKIEAIYTACEGLSQTQVEKLKSLAENVEFTTEEEFVEKLEVIRESYFTSSVKSANNSALDDEVEIEEEKVKYKSSDNLMEAYSQAISKTLVK